MQKYLKYLNANTICLALILCLGGVSLIPKSGPRPDKPDQPVVVVALVEQVKQDLAGDPDKAEQYEGLYRAASLLVMRTERKPQDYFADVAHAKTALNLSDVELRVTVEKHLSKFSDLKEWDAVSRHTFAEHVAALADACKEAM
jgi:hypothetical protein